MAECPDVKPTASRQTSNLPINIEDLLKCQAVEKQRLEFKRSWNKGPTLFQVVKTISAFANDFYNDNGGYVVIGVEEDESEDACGQIKLPPVGIEPRDLDAIQKQIIGACKGNITPSYTPILSPEVVDDKHVLVIWAQASDNRPHKARESVKGQHHYFIRKGVQTMKATDEEIKDMLRSSNKVPFDDRMARNESGIMIGSDRIKEELVEAFLVDIRSNMERDSCRSMLQKLNLVVSCGDEMHNNSLRPILVPKNVSLLIFNEQPDYYFHGATIEIAQFNRDKDVLEEHVVKGPLDQQIKKCIKYVLSTTNKEESVGSLTYPKRALREAIVNAVYHRGYEPEYNSPTKINIRPHCLEICSYPGPHQSLKPEDFRRGKDIPPVPARNRRIGEFLKDMKLAEARGTGVNTIFKSMETNKNADPQFKFNSSYFQVTLPAHPKFQAMTLLKEVEELEARNDKSQASIVLRRAFDKDRSIINQFLIEKLISLHDGDSSHPCVQPYIEHVSSITRKRCSLLKDLKKWLAENPRNNISDGVLLVEELVKVDADAKDLEEVTEFSHKLSKRDRVTKKPILSSNQNAHQLLEAYGPVLLKSDSRISWYFACIKYNIYTLNKKSRTKSTSSILPYLHDAKEYLEHAIFLSEGKEEPNLIAKQYRQLGYAFHELCLKKKAKTSDCKECYAKAREKNPNIKINSCMELYPVCETISQP